MDSGRGPDFGAGLSVQVRPTANVVFVEYQLELQQTAGVPHQLVFEGLEVDADLRTTTPLELIAGRGPALLELSGLQGSVLEGSVLASATQEPVTSTVQLLQTAYGGSVPVLDLTSSNQATELPLLNASASIVADVQNELALGREVLIPATPLTIDDWTGTGYVARDTATGEAGYYLSGAISGGVTVRSPNTWLSQSLVSDFSSLSPSNTTDVTQIAYIVKNPDGDGQPGTVGFPLGKPLAVLVTTADGTPVYNAPVTFFSAAPSIPTLTALPSAPGTSPCPGAGPTNGTTVCTDTSGIAAIRASPDTNIGDGYVLAPSTPYDQAYGFDQVSAIVSNGTVNIILGQAVQFHSPARPTFPGDDANTIATDRICERIFILYRCNRHRRIRQHVGRPADSMVS